MAVFYSSHYDNDAWRVQQIINAGVVEGQPLLNSQDWEAVKRRGKQAVENWIDEQMKYKTAVVVLIGSATADREWVRYEITKAWNAKKPLVGVRIHALKDQHGRAAMAGPDPFEKITFKGGGSLADYVPVYTPSSSSPMVDIRTNLTTWVASAYRLS